MFTLLVTRGRVPTAAIDWQVLGGYQSTVTLKCFDGDWANAAFVGQVHQQKAL